MVNNDIRKRRLTKRESLIYDELSRKGQRIFLKMSPYKRKKLVDGVIKNLERRNYDVSEFKEDNPHSENLKKRLVMRRIKNATMGTVTKPVKTALIVKKAKDKYKQKEVLLNETGEITKSKLKKTENVSRADEKLLREKKIKKRKWKRRGKNVRKIVGKKVDKALSLIDAGEQSKKKTVDDYRRQMLANMEEGFVKLEARAASKAAKISIRIGAKILIRLISGIFAVVTALLPYIVILSVIAIFISLFLGVFTATYNEENNDSGSYGLSVEVESLRNDVLSELKKHHKEQYIDLYLAVMMQESGGNGEDVFQASESLGKQPNSITRDESIAQGVKYLSGMIDKAKVKNPDDIDNIKLALQGYNFGGAYIDYAIKSDGKWTQKNVYAYAKLKSNGVKMTGVKEEILGPWAYGDQNYTEHVLRYYSANGTGTSESVENVKKVDAASRMNYLFPDGVPTDESTMRKYLATIHLKAYDANGKTGQVTITCHKKLANAYKQAFEGMYKLGFRIKSVGCYNWRNMASNSNVRSYHSYGTCIDINPDSNPATYTGGTYNPGNDIFSITSAVVKVWKDAGFYWGGEWTGYYRDYMHFTYTNN